MKHIVREVNMTRSNTMLIHGEFKGYVEVSPPKCIKQTPEEYVNFIYNTHRRFEERKAALKKANEELEKTIRLMRRKQ